jgi:hypothetical protein
LEKITVNKRLKFVHCSGHCLNALLGEVQFDYYKKIDIKHDMTQDEREKEIALKREAKKKQDDKSGNVLYLVRGHP